ncbi:MAG: endolytic transglycosylase MltG, partial [Flavobacteriales bacterium]
MMKKRVLWSLAFLIVSLGGYYSYHYYNRIYATNVVVENGRTFIYIPTGSTSDYVAEMLHQGGLIISIEDFKWLAAKKNYQGDNVVPGKYEIKNGWSNNDLIRNLRAGHGRVMVKVTIGTTRQLSEMIEKAGNDLELSSEDLTKYLNDPAILDKYGFNKYSITTLFIPNTYEFTWNTSCEEFVKRMAEEYKKFWTEERKNKAKKIGLTQSEVYILASIVQSEQQQHRSEWKDIAGLYIN